MSGKFLARAATLSLAMLLAACGGGGDGSVTPGSNGDGGTEGEDEATSQVSSIKMSASPVQLGTSGTSSSEIVVFARDSNNVLVPGASITFKVDGDATLQAVRTETDETGTAEAVLSTPQNFRNRTATVTASAGNAKSTIDINISGTTLSLEGPANASVGNKYEYIATLTDSEGNGILETLSIDSDLPNPSALYTNSEGEAKFTLEPQTTGEYSIGVSVYEGESELKSSLTVNVNDSEFGFISPAPSTEIPIGRTTGSKAITFQWTEEGIPQANRFIGLTTTRGEFEGSLPSIQRPTDSNGEIKTTISHDFAGPATIKATDMSTGSDLSATMDIEFVATRPDNMFLSANKTQLKSGEQTRITATLRDPNGNLVKNKRVVFTIPEDRSLSELSSPDSVTDSLGRASTVFIAGNGGTGEASRVRAELAEDPSISAEIPLTVAEGAYRLTIGTGNVLEEEGTPAYRKDWIVYVSDANGQAVADADVELKVTPVNYAKGFWVPGTCGEDFCWVRNETARCPSEDINRNGILDAGEDISNSNSLRPTNDAVAIPSSELSAENGAYGFQIEYPRTACGWTEVTVEAKVNVSGTEFSETATTLLSCLASDLTEEAITPPSFNGGSRYGQSDSCFDPD